MKKNCGFKIGEIVFIKGAGFPENRTDNGHESWEGVSGVVAPNPAQKGALGERMVYVRAFKPMRCRFDGGTMDATFFHHDQVKRENRPWLRKNLREIFKARENLERLRDELISLLPK